MFSHILWSLGRALIMGGQAEPLLYTRICSAVCVCVFFNYRFLVECLYWRSAKLARRYAVKCVQDRPEWRQCRICKKHKLFFKYSFVFSVKHSQCLWHLSGLQLSSSKGSTFPCLCCSAWIILCKKGFVFNSRRLCWKQAIIFQPAHISQPAKACIGNMMCGEKVLKW